MFIIWYDNNKQRKGDYIMNQELLKLMKQVVCLLDNGVKPANLQHVLGQMGCEYNNGVNFEWHYFIKRLEKFYDDDFNSDNLQCHRHDFDTVADKK